MPAKSANVSLAELLDRHTGFGAAELCRVEGERLRCLACGHRCSIGEGQRGTCKVRLVENGRLKVPFGYVAGLQCDPVEKKPFFHVLPGSDALTFGMMGCDLHCAYCQNWVTSQALRDPEAATAVRPVTPRQLIDLASRENARLVVSSYNEPLITAEWAVAVFREAAAAGLACAFVSNGNATPEVLDFLRPWIVAYKVDLKTFNDRNYRTLGTTLSNVLKTIEMVRERGLWLEVVTLIIPGFNDDAGELRRAARFLASVDKNIPWHVTAFHKDYRMTDPDATPVATLVRAAEMGAEEGLRYVYAGNLPGRVGSWENTHCPSCRAAVIERTGYLIRSYRLTPQGRCLACDTQVPGTWPEAPGDVRTGNDVAAFRQRLPRPVQVQHESSPDSARRSSLPIVDPSSHPGASFMSADAAADTRTSTIRLEAEAKSKVLSAATAMLHAVTLGERVAFPSDLAQVGEHQVAGAFVSLKKGAHLRSCCGLLGARPIALARALEHAVDRAVWEDERFPPVSPAELEHLRMEVWLLYTPEPVQAKGPDKRHAVTVGKHGVKVVRGDAGALFLPSVAVENEWDAERFLDRVCIKAGLPATAWRDDTTALFTFEGEALQSALTRPENYRPSRLLGDGDFSRLVALCRANLAAQVMGAVPRPFAGVPDGAASGIILLVELPDKSEMRQFTRISLRPGIPLQATLFSLIQAAGRYLASAGVEPEAIDNIPLGVTVLSDPMLHGSVADPDLAGHDPRSRAILLVERNKTGLVFDAARSGEEVVTETARKAGVAEPESAGVFSLAVTTNLSKVEAIMAPQPASGPAMRPPAVAGKFYPGDARELSRMVDELLAGECATEEAAAAMVPHAGLKFSGRVAADVLKRIRLPSTVIILGPKHTALGMDWAVAPHQTWAFPGGKLPSDPLLAHRLAQAIPGLELDAAAHQQEHAVEVELPLLARLAPNTKVVGIALGRGSLKSCFQFAEGLANVLRGWPERPLLLVSSDMNHFATDAETRRLDALALAALETGDPERLHEVVSDHSISMCGVLPAVIVLQTLRLLDRPVTARRVGYATSADVTGNPSRVVGYAGVLMSQA